MQYVLVYIANFAAVQLYVCMQQLCVPQQAVSNTLMMMHEPRVQHFECRLSCQPCIGAVLMLPEHTDLSQLHRMGFKF